MNNAEVFQEVFGIYATELWAMPESDFLDWLNAPADGAKSAIRCNDRKNDCGDVGKEEPV